MTGVEIRALREKLGWTQMALAEADWSNLEHRGPLGARRNGDLRTRRQTPPKNRCRSNGRGLGRGEGDYGFDQAVPSERMYGRELRVRVAARLPAARTQRGHASGLSSRPRRRPKNISQQTSIKVARGEYISPEKIPTFAKAGEEWLREKADRHPATVQGWRVHLKHLAKLDNVRLDRIDVAAVERVRDELRATLGAKTISAVLTTCAAVFKLAQRRGWVANNPAAIAERPRRAVAELTVADETDESDKGLRAVRPDEVLSAGEIKKLLSHASPGLYLTLFATVAATGMRPEEVYALKWTRHFAGRRSTLRTTLPFLVARVGGEGPRASEILRA